MLKLKIISPEKILFSGDVLRVFVPGTLGEFEILDNHAPIISTLEEGTVAYDNMDGKRVELNICGGFAEVKKNEVSLCIEV